MGRKGVIYVLALLAILMLSEHGAKGQDNSEEMPPSDTPMPTEPPTTPTVGPETTTPPTTTPGTTTTPTTTPETTTPPTTTPGTTTLVFESTISAGVVISSNTCPSHVEEGESLCSSVNGVSDINTFLDAGNMTDACSHSLLQYACANIGNASANNLATILTCFLGNDDAVTSQGVISLLISKINIDTLGTAINMINNRVPTSSISDDNKEYMMTAVWEKLQTETLSQGFLASWLQERMYSFIPFITMETLNCMKVLPLTCDQFETVVAALSLSYTKFDQAKKEEIASWITQFLQALDCQKPTAGDSIEAYYQSFVSNVNVTDFSLAFGNIELGSAIEAFTDFQLAQYVSESGVFSSLEQASSVIQYLDTQDYSFLFNFLNTLQITNYSQDVMYTLLYTLVTKVNSTDDPLCKPSLKAIFQAKLSYLFEAVNKTILDLIVPTDCSDFQEIYGAIDEVYSELSADIQQLVYEYRLSFLNAEAVKSGSACTYGLSSLQWVQMNFGKSIGLFLYSDMIRLNPNFDGYEALSVFNANQTLDLVIQSNILTSPNPANYELHISALITFLKSKGFVYLKEFLIELRIILIRINTNVIVNLNVRTLLFQGIWDIVNPQMYQFTSNDWYLWFYEYLSFCVSSISVTELSMMTNTVVDDCSNMQNIVGGLNNVFDYMSLDTKSDCTNWIIGFLRNDTSRCEGGDWLNSNFKQFKQYVSITVIRELDFQFNLLGSLADLTANQIGQAVVTENGALSNVSYMEIVFEVITNSTEVIGNLGAFWDSFNGQYEEVEQFTDDVKYKMLEWTIDEISVRYPTFTAADYTLWFEKRLYLVTVVITTTILNEFSLTMDCDSYKAVVNAMSINYDQTITTSQDDVFDFLTNFLEKGTKCSDTQNTTVSYIESSFGNYSGMATYADLAYYYPKFNPFEGGVLVVLTNTQIGDMIVEANVYQSTENATLVFQYLQTISVGRVDACMAQFTTAALKNNIVISISVGQFILQSYLNIIKTSIATYNQTQIIQLFQQRIFVLIQYFTVETLELFVINDCGTLVVIVAQLDTGFSSMSDQTRTVIATWILGILQNTRFGGCTSISGTTSVWVGSTFKSFFGYVSLVDVKAVYPSLDIMAIITNTSISQKVEYLTGSQEILQNVNTTITVLESLSGSGTTVVTATKIYSFLAAFSAAYGMQNVKYMTSEVREEAMNFLFKSLTADLNSLTTVQVSQFQGIFLYFLPGITIEAVQSIPMTITCDVFEAFFSAFSSVFSELPEDVAQFIFDTIINYLQANYSASADVCSGLYTNSITYVQNIYFQFLQYATVYQLELYYSKFDVYEVLSLLTGKQLGNLMINTTAISNQFQAVQILVEVEKRDYSVVLSFMSEITRVAEEKGIISLPDGNIQNLIYTAVWTQVQSHLTTQDDYIAVFNGTLQLIISSISVTAIASLPVTTDCTSQSYVIKAFGQEYDNLDDDQKNAMYEYIKGFNMNVKNSKGSACGTASGTSGEWIMSYFGPFVKQAQYQDFQAANSNFSAAEALPEMSGGQVADYAINSKALWRADTAIALFYSMGSIDKVQDFYNRVNVISPTDLSNSPVVEVIVSETFKIISQGFLSFTQTNWTQWTQVILTNVLFAINSTELETIPFPLPCGSYQQVVLGFSNVFDNMNEETRKTVYDNCVKRQLSSISSQGGVRCGQLSQKSQEWMDLNLGQFSIYANLTDLLSWNLNFQITTVIITLSPGQLAEAAVGSIDQEDVACQVAGRVQQFAVQDAYTFLDTFYATIQQTNKPEISSQEIAFKLMSASITSIKSAFSRYSLSDWETLFDTRLQPFLFSINADLLTTILSAADCNGYNVIVNSLDSVFDSFSSDTQQSLFAALESFLNNQSPATGACPVSGEDSSTTAERLFGKFMKYVTYSAFSTYIQNFDGLSAISLLSPDQTASLAFSGNILTDATSSEVLVNTLSGMTFIQIDAFMSSFANIVAQKNLHSLPNPNIQASLFNAIYGIVSGQFSTFSAAQWNTYWNVNFQPFLSSLNESQVQQIPENINCNAFQSVISGCSSQYSSLPENVQNAIYIKAMSYLTANKPASGPACPVNSGGSGAWIEINLGLFSEFATIPEINALYQGFSFTDAVSYLTAGQLGSYVASVAVLSDKDTITKVMNGITSDTIGEFLDAFNIGVRQAGISQTSSSVKTFFLGEIFCKLGPNFSLFTVGDYASLFQDRLSFFISSIDAKCLGFINTDITCDALAAIMKPLIAVTNPDNPQAIYNFVVSVLEAQGTSSGACTSGLDTKAWMLAYFGQYSEFAAYTVFTTLNPNFQVTEVTEYLTATQLASASTSSTIIRNSTAITTLVLSFSGSIDDFLTYIKSLQLSYLQDPTILSNIKVRDALLMAVADAVFPLFADISLAEAQSWLNAINFLIPGLNSTMLSQFPLAMPCAQYQAIVTSVSQAYSSLTNSRKNDFAAFEIQYLTYQYAQNQDACSLGTTGTVSYMQANIGSFCPQITSDQALQVNPALNAVSYNQYCSLQ